MTQITSGLRAALSNPLIYDLFQRCMGAHHGRLEFVKNFVRPFGGMRVLDIGCGTAEILNYLPTDVEYYGYDISNEYISTAKNRFGKRGVFNCGLFNSEALEQLPLCDVVLMSGVLHHMDDAVVQSLLPLISDIMTSAGKLITKDPCFSEGQSSIARFLIANDRGENVRTPRAYEALAHKVFPVVVGTLKHRAWIPYTHWIMVCTK
jgi:2-polyprenyl-3-methyl-5-hydroxy-6-metoxy-1,4-benzoquinol methylase